MNVQHGTPKEEKWRRNSSSQSFLGGGVGEIAAATVRTEPNGFVPRENGVGFVPCGGRSGVGITLFLIGDEAKFLGGDEVAQEDCGGSADGVVRISLGEGDGAGGGCGWCRDGKLRQAAVGGNGDDARRGERELIGFSTADELADAA